MPTRSRASVRQTSASAPGLLGRRQVISVPMGMAGDYQTADWALEGSGCGSATRVLDGTSELRTTEVVGSELTGRMRLTSIVR